MGSPFLFSSVQSHIAVAPVSSPTRATCSACDLMNAAIASRPSRSCDFLRYVPCYPNTGRPKSPPSCNRSNNPLIVSRSFDLNAEAFIEPSTWFWRTGRITARLLRSAKAVTGITRPKRSRSFASSPFRYNSSSVASSQLSLPTAYLGPRVCPVVIRDNACGSICVANACLHFTAPLRRVAETARCDVMFLTAQ